MGVTAWDCDDDKNDDNDDDDHDDRWRSAVRRCSSLNHANRNGHGNENAYDAVSASNN